MRIAILGAGAMGSLFGGYLSQHNDVWLVDTDRNKIDTVRNNGITIREQNGDFVFHPNAVCSASELGPMDLVILFVKAMQSREALETNRRLIGEKSWLLSLQNGAGHEEIMSKFVSLDRLIIGTTQHNSSLAAPGLIRHGGGGRTCLGLLQGDSSCLQPMAENFSSCGFDTAVSQNIRKQVWQKLFLNASASALTAILQVRLGFIAESDSAWMVAQRLIGESVRVANADGQSFDLDQVIADVREVLSRARDGYTSIYADICDGVPTEVDTISGSVVRAAKRLGIPVPTHEAVVSLVHAMEGKPA